MSDFRTPTSLDDIAFVKGATNLVAQADWHGVADVTLTLSNDVGGSASTLTALHAAWDRWSADAMRHADRLTSNPLRLCGITAYVDNYVEVEYIEESSDDILLIVGTVAGGVETAGFP